MVVESSLFEIERVVQEGRIGRGQCPHALRLFLQLVEQHRENEGAGVVVRAVTFGKIGHGEYGMLENARRICHPRKMVQLQLRQLALLLVERFRRKGFSRQYRLFDPGQIEGPHVKPRHVAPDHLAPQLVSVLAHGVAARIVAQQADHLACNGLGVAKRHQHATIFRQQFSSVPVRR